MFMHRRYFFQKDQHSKLACMIVPAFGINGDDRSQVKIGYDWRKFSQGIAILLLISIHFSLAFVLNGCDSTEQMFTQSPKHIETSAPSAVFPFEVTDSNGDTIVFEEAPRRIVAIDSAVVEILFSIGEGSRLIGTHDFVSYPPEVKDLTRVGGAFNLNKEAILELDPDLVYVFSEGSVADLQQLGLRVLYIKTLNTDFRQVSDNIRLWGSILGKRQVAEEIASTFDSKVFEIEEVMNSQGDGPTVFQDEGELWSPGPDTLIGSVFELLKLQNIAHDVSGYKQISAEVIIARGPEIIIASYNDNISDDPVFAELPAVKNGRVFVQESDLLSVPGPRYADGIKDLAKWIYPDLFP